MDRLSLLVAYAAELRGRKFQAGSHDCALFAAEWVKRVTGQDLARSWRGKYRTLARGQRLIGEAGFASPADIASQHLPEVPPALAQVGDIVLIDAGDGFAALGILAGDLCYCLRPDGLGLVPRAWALRAFSTATPLPKGTL